jgi:hypothetical protein
VPAADLSLAIATSATADAVAGRVPDQLSGGTE